MPAAKQRVIGKDQAVGVLAAFVQSSWLETKRPL